MLLPLLARETMIAVEAVLAERQMVLAQLQESGNDAVQQAKLMAVLARLTDRLRTLMALGAIVPPDDAPANQGS